MSSSLEVSIPLRAEIAIGDILAPAFSGGFFQSVAVGAIEWHAAGNHWFLAGYALEHFLGLVLAPKIRPPASIALLTVQDVELNSYHQQCADAVRGSHSWDGPCSPFERVDEQHGVTVLEPKHLTQEALVALTRWADRFRQATIRVYGDIMLSFRGSPPVRAFQEVPGADEAQLTPPSPFLNLHLYNADPSVGRRLVIRTQDPIWLRQAQALGGRVTPEDADANLQELAHFARMLAYGKRSGTHAIELSVEGSFFTREEARIRAAFQDLL